MLSRITSRVRDMRVLTWDLEWHTETLQPIIAGLYDGQHYRAFGGHSSSRPIESFLRHILTPRYDGAFFFAHFGGRFDAVFILHELRNTRYGIQCYRVGSSHLLIKITDGKHVWKLCDSQFLYKESLAVMGRSIGLPKLDCPFNAPYQQQREYNERDCVILYRVLERTAATLAALGSGMSYTIASTGMQLFRRKYLTEDIPTSGIMNEEVRQGYVAARVEPIAIYSPRGWHFDLNSSFPYSMLSPLPGRHIRTNYELGDCCIAHVRVRVPPTHLPPLPCRVDKSVYFPYGEFDGWYTSVDIARLYQSGGRVLKVYVAHHYEPFSDFASYVKDVYRLRLKAIEAKDEFLILFFKKLMNSVYGKTSERPVKERLFYIPDGVQVTCPHKGEHTVNGRALCMTWRGPNVWACVDIKEPEHAHVPIAMWTTANSRAVLLDYGESAPNLAYWDTDSLFGGGRWESSNDLGKLKAEYDGEEYTDGVFLRPKLYSVMRSVPHAPIVKAKGFPKLTRDQFFDLASGLGVDVRVFAGPNTTMLGGGPSESMRRKSLFRICPECEGGIEDDACWDHPTRRPIPAWRSRPKRNYHADGLGSDPWSHDELMSDWNPRQSPAFRL